MGVGSGEEHHNRGCGDIGDGLSEAGNETSPWTHGASSKGVSTTGVWHCGGHFSDGEDEAVVHHYQDEEGDEEPSESSDVQTEVPSREVTRDNGSDGETPEAPHAGGACQLAFVEVGLIDLGIGDACHLGVFTTHVRCPICRWRPSDLRWPETLPTTL